MGAISEVRELHALVRQAEEAQAAFGYIATSLEQQNTPVLDVAKHARFQAGRLHDVLNPKED